MVEQVDGKEVHVVFGDSIVLRIGRKEIVWDEGNMRWECESTNT